jgi:hypothetical protein
VRDLVLDQNETEERDALGAAGAARAVVDALAAHRASEDVQENGCDALVWLVMDHAGNQAAAEAARAERAVVDAINAHPASEEVQGNGCGALGRLVNNHAGNQAAAEAAGAARAVVDAMNAHRASEDVQHQACGALEHLARDARRRRPRAVEAVVAALQMLPAGWMMDRAHRALRVLAPGHALLQ